MLSNSQKIDFSISKKVLLEEECTLKIAVNAKLHKLLDELDRSKLANKHIDFSIVFTIEENYTDGLFTNKLYDELCAINELEAVNILEVQLEAETSNE